MRVTALALTTESITRQERAQISIQITDDQITDDLSEEREVQLHSM